MISDLKLSYPGLEKGIGTGERLVVEHIWDEVWRPVVLDIVMFSLSLPNRGGVLFQSLVLSTTPEGVCFLSRIRGEGIFVVRDHLGLLSPSNRSLTKREKLREKEKVSFLLPLVSLEVLTLSRKDSIFRRIERTLVWTDDRDSSPFSVIVCSGWEPFVGGYGRTEDLKGHFDRLGV